MDRQYFWDLGNVIANLVLLSNRMIIVCSFIGSYDEGMDVWGGENLGKFIICPISFSLGLKYIINYFCI